MRTLVIYESMFGNTQRVAEAIAEGLRDRGPVELREVAAAPREIDTDVDLVVIGGPTHVHGLSRPRTRSDAAHQATGTLVSTGPGVREWLASLGPIPDGV